MDKCPPDLYDVLGSLVIVAGVETIMYWPRGRLKERLAGQGKQFELKRRVISKKVVFETDRNLSSRELAASSHVPIGIPLCAAQLLALCEFGTNLT
jgi:hypothetical protein